MTLTHALFLGGSTQPAGDITNGGLREQARAESAARALSADAKSGVWVRAQDLDSDDHESWPIPVAYFLNGYRLDTRLDTDAEPIRAEYLADDQVVATAELVGDTWYLYKAAESTVARGENVTLAADEPDREHTLRSFWHYAEDWVPDPA